MNATHTPVVVGLGKAVHVADGTGTLCRPKALNVAKVPHEQVTCKRCLKAVAALPATETPEPVANSTEAKRSGKKTPAECRCGCELLTAGGLYRPGHDARHASWVARQVINGSLSYNDGMDMLDSDPLRLKAHRQIERAAQKGAAA
ncbi:MAG: hypothetical protein WBA05_14120 [Gordonia sp. (in: high G+C Gram-positive bacteria)]|uniref:hypothetical protein n=1 Tax=Gordonia sp. (in: high G+C Gram-positive bacteria) TaxID=84139 RepID=UPI003C792AFE